MPHPIELTLKQVIQRMPTICPYCYNQLNATLHILNDGSLAVHADCACGKIYATNYVQQILYGTGCEWDEQKQVESVNIDNNSDNEENKRLQDTISMFSRQCSDVCDDIFECACQRAIARMNKELAPELGGNDGAVGDGFTFFEVLSVSICHFGYTAGEINPYLPSYISDILEDECDNFSSSDLLVIKYGECIYRGSYGMYDFHTELLNRMTDTFYRLLEDTYNSDKVQKYCNHT